MNNPFRGLDSMKIDQEALKTQAQLLDHQKPEQRKLGVHNSMGLFVFTVERIQIQFGLSI